uniref:Serpentine receptor n=1 Tax=Parastrongyloides trichosuri TaxID=131310 RepID=A0A0N4Z9X4_PARTI
MNTIGTFEADKNLKNLTFPIKYKIPKEIGVILVKCPNDNYSKKYPGYKYVPPSSKNIKEFTGYDHDDTYTWFLIDKIKTDFTCGKYKKSLNVTEEWKYTIDKRTSNESEDFKSNCKEKDVKVSSYLEPQNTENFIIIITEDGKYYNTKTISNIKQSEKKKVFLTFKGIYFFKKNTNEYVVSPHLYCNLVFGIPEFVFIVNKDVNEIDKKNFFYHIYKDRNPIEVKIKLKFNNETMLPVYPEFQEIKYQMFGINRKKELKPIWNRARPLSVLKIYDYGIYKFFYECDFCNDVNNTVVNAIIFFGPNKDSIINDTKNIIDIKEFKPGCKKEKYTYAYLKKVTFGVHVLILDDDEYTISEELKGIVFNSKDDITIKMAINELGSQECVYETLLNSQIIEKTIFSEEEKDAKEKEQKNDLHLEHVKEFIDDLFEKSTKNTTAIEIRKMFHDEHENRYFTVVFGIFAIVILTIFIAYGCFRINHVFFLSPYLKERELRRIYTNIYIWWDELQKCNFSSYGESILEPCYTSKKVLKVKKETKVLGYEKTVVKYHFEDICVVDDEKFNATSIFDVYKINSPYLKCSYMICNYPKEEYAKFWEMLYRKDIGIIIAILSENSSLKNVCFSHYWPELSATYGDLTIEKESFDKYLMEYNKITYKITDIKTKNQKIVTIFYVFHWKPNSLPYTEKCIVELRYLVEELAGEKSILIHSEKSPCSRIYVYIYFAAIYNAFIDYSDFYNPKDVILNIRDSIKGGAIGIADYNMIMRALVEVFYMEEYIINKKRYLKYVDAFEQYLYRRSKNKENFGSLLKNFLSFAADFSVLKLIEMLHGMSTLLILNNQEMKKKCSRFYMINDDDELKRRNKYSEIPCQDNFTIDCRSTKLNRDDLNGYIHANLMKYPLEVGKNREIIMCQSPNNHTIDNIVEMIYNHNVCVIAMITSPTSFERNSNPDLDYIPAKISEKITYGDYEIILENQKKSPDEKLIQSFCKITEGDEEGRKFVHLHIKNWSDQSLTKNEPDVLALYKLIIEYAKPNHPILIHCNNGVGKTGTLSMIIHMFDFFDKSEYFDPLMHLEAIRKHRYHAVLREHDFLFAISVLYENYKVQLYEFNPSVYFRFYNICSYANKQKMI